MWLLTIYQNNVRYYSAPVPTPTKEERLNGDITISTKSLLISYDKDSTGTYISIKQEITDEEFQFYKNHPETFTIKNLI